jgi:hypothetical protein
MRDRTPVGAARVDGMARRSQDAFGAVAEEFAAWLQTDGQIPKADPQVAGALLNLVRDYLGLADPSELGPGDLRELLLDVYPRKVTVLDRQDAAEVVPTARALVDFLAGSGRISSPAALRKELDELEPGFLDVVMDPARWGPARAFTQAMAADGVDFDDQAAVDAWIATYNTRQLGPGGSGEWPGEDEEYPDLREAFGLPDQLPALRLPDEAELARDARGSALMAQARQLAQWAGERRSTLTDDGELAPADAAEAAQMLGINVPPGATTVPPLRQAWHLARCLWFVEEDDEGHTLTTDEAARWPGGDDEEVLDLWSSALGHLVGHSLSVDDHEGAFGDLLLGSAAAGLLVILLLARDKGVSREDCRELVMEAATTDLNGAAARQRRTAWNHAHGDMSALVLERLTAHGAITLDGDTVRFTALGLWRMREELADVVEIPLLPDSAEMSAAELVAFGTEASQAELDRETDAWLAARPPEQAARELLGVAAGVDCAQRMIAATLATRIGAAAEPAWRDSLTDPALRPYAKLALGQIAGDEPGMAGLPTLEITPDEAILLLGDSVAAMAENVDGTELAAALRQAVPAGEELQVIEAMARSGHPATGDVLNTLGRYHPDKKVAKAARKAAFKAHSRQ